MNVSYITLLPKKETPLLIQDYRPISLLHSIPKLLSKVLANRVQGTIFNLVDPMQSAFIKGRSISENFLLASDLVQCALKRKKPTIVLKLDFHKAFDTVNWNALYSVLAHRGFDETWITWLSKLLESGRAHILINGEMGESITYKRGVRQGDPLSPYLFILVADVLQQMIKNAFRDEQLLHPIDIQAPPPILQYVDDTLILIKGSLQQGQILKGILDTFAYFSGLQINYHKSTLVPIHMEQAEITAVSNLLLCPTSALPCNYLGLPLSTSKITHKMLSPIIDRIDKRLAGWIPGLLSWGERLIMINAVMSAIPNYFMVAVRWPDKSIEAIDKLRRAFLWKGDRPTRGEQCLVAWQIVTLSKEQGGLGVHDLGAHNMALLLKIASKMLSSTSEPCFQWLRSQNIQRQIPTMAKQSDTLVWKSVVSMIDTVIASTKVSVGNRELTLFWKDHWTALGRLHFVFPTLASFARNINCTVTSRPRA